MATNRTGIYIAGKTTSYGNGSFDLVLLGYNQTRELESFQTWGGAGSDVSHGLTVDGDALYVVGETTSLGQGSSDVLLLKAGPGVGPPTPEEPPPSNNLLPVLLVAAVTLAVIVAVLLARRRRPRHP